MRPEGDYGVRKRSFRLMLKLRCSTPETCTASAPAGRAGELWSAEAKLPPDAEADASALQIGSRAAPLAHRIGEGLGGKKRVFRWRGWCGVFLGIFEFKIGRCFGGGVGCAVASGSTI